MKSEADTKSQSTYYICQDVDDANYSKLDIEHCTEALASSRQTCQTATSSTIALTQVVQKAPGGEGAKMSLLYPAGGALGALGVVGLCQSTHVHVCLHLTDME
jgi:hypothetical protein